MNEFLSAVQGNSVTDIRTVILSTLVAFFLAHLIAIIYSRCHRGISYSTTFVQSLILGGVVASMLMMAVGNNLVWGIGIVGTLALVRFRTNLRDPRDMVFIFAALASGIAAGVGAYAVGFVGAISFCLIAVYLNYIPFGARGNFDGLLRFTLANFETGKGESDGILHTYCSKCVLVSLQQVAQSEESEHAYQVRFRRIDSQLNLVRDLEKVPGLSNLSLILQETHVDL
jgi:hypothetical protein